MNREPIRAVYISVCDSDFATLLNRCDLTDIKPKLWGYRLKADTAMCWATFLASKYEVSVSSSGCGMNGIGWFCRLSQSRPSNRRWRFSSANKTTKISNTEIFLYAPFSFSKLIKLWKIVQANSAYTTFRHFQSAKE